VTSEPERLLRERIAADAADDQPDPERVAEVAALLQEVELDKARAEAAARRDDAAERAG
jgi:hypothetical protein